MRCSVCNRPAAGATQLCAGCLAAIKRAEDERAIRLDLLVEPDSRSEITAPPLPSTGFSGMYSRGPASDRAAHCMSFVAASLSVASLIAIPANWHVREIPQRVAARDVTEMNLSAAAQQAAPETPVTFVLPPMLPNVDTLVPLPALQAAPREQIRVAARNVATTRNAAAEPSKASAEANPRPAPMTAQPPAAQVAPPVRSAAVTTPSPDPGKARQEPVTLDRALARCAEQSLLKRSWCEHRARVEYCESRADKGAECATPTMRSDSGS